MKTKTAVFAFTASLAAVAGVAPLANTVASAAPALTYRPSTEIIRHVEAAFDGKVTAIERDNSRGKPPHYHVDVRFPRANPTGLVTVDVDAKTRTISPHETAHRRAGSTIPASASLLAGWYIGN